MKQIFGKVFFKYFAISFSCTEAILLIQFLFNIKDDLVGKNAHISDFLYFTLHSSINLFGVSFILGVLIATILTFKEKSQNQNFNFKRAILLGTLATIILSFFLFTFNNSTLPKSKLELYSLLYDFKAAYPDSVFKRSDKNLFNSSPATLSISKINFKVDSINKELDKQVNICDSVIRLLPDSTANAFYKNLKLHKKGIAKMDNAPKGEIDHAQHKRAEYILRSFEYKYENLSRLKEKLYKEIASRYMPSVALFLLFIIGASFGYYFNDQISFLLIILGLFTMILFYGSFLGIERATTNGTYNHFGTIISALFLFAATTTFVVISIRKQSKPFKKNN